MMVDDIPIDGETGEKPIKARLNPSTTIDILCRHGGGYRIQASLVIETKEEAGAASEVLSILGRLLESTDER